MVRMPRQHYTTLYVEEDTDTGHLLYEEWAEARLARVRLVPFDGSDRSTVYTADLRWQDRAEVRAGFALAAAILTGHDGLLAPDEIGQVIRAGVDAQAWPAGQRESFVTERLAAVLTWRESAQEVAL